MLGFDFIHRGICLRSRTAVTAALWLAAAFATAGCERSDPSRVSARVVTCEVCHGGRGHRTLPMSPPLAGQDRAYMAKQLRAYKDGSRFDTVMSPLAAALTDRDIEDMSAHFASLDPCESN